MTAVFIICVCVKSFRSVFVQNIKKLVISKDFSEYQHFSNKI